jgi:hypothetical protein
MTYLDLLQKLQKLNAEELQQTALIRLAFAEEIVPLNDFIPLLCDDQMGDVVDDGQYLLGAEY